MAPRAQRLLRRIQEYEASGNRAAARITLQAFVRDVPDHVAGWLRLSEWEQHAGLYRDSLHAARSAAAAQKRSQKWSLLAYVTSRLLVFNELNAAADLIEAADWNAPAVLRQSPVLSQQLWLAGRYEQALALIDAAQERASPSHLLAYSRAVALRHLGRMHEAGRELERCIALAPAYAPAHWTLAHHAPAAAERRRIPRLAEAMAAHAPASAEAIDLLYALYREYESEGDTGNAWAALTEGAHRKHALLRGDSTIETRVMRALSGERSGCPSHPAGLRGDVDCVFIVGLPRTGTTLLERVVGGHRDVASAGELNDFHAALCWQSGRFLSVRDLPSLSGSGAKAVGGAGARYRETTAAYRRGRRILLDKNPSNFIHAWLIAAALPTARILCLRRNPMDACFSNFKELFADNAYGYSYDLHEVADHYAAFEELRRHWAQVLGDRFMTVDYESLVAEPDVAARRVLGFCGLDYDEECVHIERNLQPVPTASAAQVRQPIHRRFVGAWRRYESALQPVGERLLAHGVEVEG